MFFNEREIWWAHLGENVGSEQNGKNDQFERPVLVIKKYHAGLLTILPISTTDKTSPYLVPLKRGAGSKQGNIVLSQIRTISSKRLIRKQRMLPEEEYTEVRSRLLKML